MTEDHDDPQAMSFLLVLGTFLRPSPESFVERLRVAEEARGVLLDDYEHLEWRQSILDELPSPKSFQATYGWALPVFFLASLSAAALGLYLDTRWLSWFGSSLAVVLLATLVVLAFGVFRKSRLSEGDRIHIVDHLLSESAISADEAEVIRAGIRNFYHGYARTR